MWNRQSVDNRSGIYAILNKLTGKKYIGRAENIHNRWKTHLRELKKGVHYNKELQLDVNKYGIVFFEFIVLDYEESYIMNPKIRNINTLELIHIFNEDKENLYNIVTGKDIIAFGVYEQMSDEYDVKIDYKDADCTSNQNKPLKWNVVVTSFMTGKRAYVHLVSPTSRTKTAYLVNNIEIREKFIDNHINYRYVSMDFFNLDDYFSYHEQIERLVNKIRKCVDED